MSPIVVMVAFYSARGSTEKLATASAVGAVQGRAAIRMRRMSDLDPSRKIAELPEFRESLERMNKHYVAPAEADVLEADALIFGVPADFTVSSGEWTTYLDLLARLQLEGKLRGKVGVALGSEPGLAAFSEAIAPLELVAGGADSSHTEQIPPDGIERAIALGRRVADVARSLKDSTD